MEAIRGQVIAAVQDEGGRIDPVRIVNVIRQIANGLQQMEGAHRQEIEDLVERYNPQLQVAMAREDDNADRAFVEGILVHLDIDFSRLPAGTMQAIANIVQGLFGNNRDVVDNEGYAGAMQQE